MSKLPVAQSTKRDMFASQMEGGNSWRKGLAETEKGNQASGLL